MFSYLHSWCFLVVESSSSQYSRLLSCGKRPKHFIFAWSCMSFWGKLKKTSRLEFVIQTFLRGWAALEAEIISLVQFQQYHCTSTSSACWGPGTTDTLNDPCLNLFHVTWIAPWMFTGDHWRLSTHSVNHLNSNAKCRCLMSLTFFKCTVISGWSKVPTGTWQPSW